MKGHKVGGAGPNLPWAERVGESGAITGYDLSAAMLAIAAAEQIAEFRGVVSRIAAPLIDGDLIRTETCSNTALAIA